MSDEVRWYEPEMEDDPIAPQFVRVIDYHLVDGLPVCLVQTVDDGQYFDAYPHELS